MSTSATRPALRYPAFAAFAVGVFLLFVLIYLLYPKGLIAAGVATALLLMLMKPEYSYLLFIVSSPLYCFYIQVGRDDSKRFFLLDVFIACAFVAWILMRLARARPPYPGSTSDRFIAALALLAALSIFWTTNLPQGSHELFRLGICFATFALTVALVRDERTLRWVFGTMIAVSLVEAVLCMASIYSTTGYEYNVQIIDHLNFGNRFWGKRLWHPPEGRGIGTDTAHNIAVYMNMPIFFSLGYWMIAKARWQRAFWAGVIAVLTAGVAATLTKGAVIALWFGCVFMIVNLRPLRRRFLLAVSLMVLLTMAAFAVARFDDLTMSMEYTQKQFQTESKRTSAGSRITWWKRGFEKLMDTNGIGYGIGGYMKNVRAAVPDGTHAAVLFDLGIVGFFIWFVLFFSGFQTFWARLRACSNEYYRRLLLAYLGGYLMMMLSWTVTLYYSYVHLWIYLGLGHALVRISQDAPPESDLRGAGEQSLVSARSLIG